MSDTSTITIFFLEEAAKTMEIINSISNLVGFKPADLSDFYSGSKAPEQTVLGLAFKDRPGISGADVVSLLASGTKWENPNDVLVVVKKNTTTVYSGCFQKEYTG